MNTTISDPTPAPKMPVMWAAVRCSTEQRWSGFLFDSKLLASSHVAAFPGSRLITIDPDAPSFEAGPTEWRDAGDRCSLVADGGTITLRDGSLSVVFSNTRTDIGHLIRALVTKWHEAKEGS